MERNLFQLIDLDRTLFDTASFAKAITNEIEDIETGLGAELEIQYEAAYAREETFFLLRYLRETRGDEWFETLVDRVVAKMGSASLALAAAEERLAFADTITSYTPSWGILTYGDEIDQRMKTKIIGLQNAPMILSPTPDKADLIRSWQNPDGTFQLPEEFGGGVVNELTLEDDKLRAFRGLPRNVQGFWIASDEHAAVRLAEAKQSDVPQTVVQVKNLSEIIDKLSV